MQIWSIFPNSWWIIPLSVYSNSRVFLLLLETIFCLFLKLDFLLLANLFRCISDVSLASWSENIRTFRLRSVNRKSYQVLVKEHKHYTEKGTLWSSKRSLHRKHRGKFFQIHSIKNLYETKFIKCLNYILLNISCKHDYRLSRNWDL